MREALDAVGQTYKGFLITKYLPLDELQSTLIELVHEPSGARVMHIANSDPENLFCLSFQTLPSSSNGVAHILEHTVLCGSKKFPVKDPFFAMTRRSLNTFMNAFTGQDFTCYPASSQVEKDFYNLLEVYLDAVFFPELKKTSFLQEGHRLELIDPKSEHSPLQYQGVVYNEMKGAMMSSESRLWQQVALHLTPDLPYRHNSGGDPEEIPHLTHEELVEFHRAYYHPSRCLFYFYGNLPLSQHLDFIEKHALRGVEKLSLLPPLPLQTRFKSPVRASATYPIAEGESTEGKTEIAFAWLTAHLSAQSDVLALCLIEALLMETDVSPLKIALLNSGLCTEADSSIDIEMSEVPLMIVCKGCEPESEKKLAEIVYQTLTELVEKEIPEDKIEGALHQLEFQRTEIGGEGGPFGLTLFMRAALIKQHGNEPEHALFIHTLFAELRERLKDRNYLPSLIKKYLIENLHFVSLVLQPDPDLEKKELAAEKGRLEEIRKKLTPKERQKIVEQAKMLLDYQEKVERQSLDCLPTVTLADIPRKARDFPLTHKETPNLDIFHHDCFTNQIIYADLLFDLPHIEKEELPMLSLLAKLWTELGCGKLSYDQTTDLMQLHTGGIDAHLALHVSADDPNVLKPAFSLRGKALDHKAEPFFDLITQYAEGPNWSEKKRIKEFLLQHLVELDQMVANNPLNYAIQLSLAGYSSASYIYNQWNGLPYYHLIKELAKSSSDEWIKKLSHLASQIVRSGKPHLILSCSQTQFNQLLSHTFYALGQRPVQASATPWKGAYEPEKIASQARLISAPVSFTALGMRTASYQDPGVAELMLSTELLENVILHKEVREKGGAYGTGASYSPTTGNYHLFSFRDPHLAQTIETLEHAIETLCKGDFTERELEEAKIGLIGALDNPVTPGGRAIVAYAWHRSNRTLAQRQKLREEILNATKPLVIAAVSKALLNKPTTLITFLGKELWKKEEKKLKKNLELHKL